MDIYWCRTELDTKELFFQVIRQQFKLHILINNNNNSHLFVLRADVYSKLISYINLFNSHDYFLRYVLVLFFPHLAQKRTEAIPQ